MPLINRFFNWLESRVDSFPPDRPDVPPTGLGAFCWHYTRPFWPLLLASTLLSAVVALIEVSLFAFLGELVDLLAGAERATLWQEHGDRLLFMGALTLLALPLLNFMSESVVHQGLRGSFAMRTRWMAHRYVLRQSMDFFANEFAGRVATKVMQTALGVRDAVMRPTEVLVYVAIYFIGAMVLMVGADGWLVVPLVAWFAGYVVAGWYFIPKLGKLSAAQADMRSLVTGRVVDSYTNISTVKLFAHADREDAYAKEGMKLMLGSVHRSMRMATLLTTTLQVLSGFLVFAMGTVSVWLWHQNAISTGAIAFALGLTLRMQGMSQWIIWEVAGLFEDVGVVQDGLETIARERIINDAPEAKALAVTAGAIRFENVTFNYGKSTRAGERAVLDRLSLEIAPGEKVGLVGRSGAGKSTLTSLLLRFHDLERGALVDRNGRRGYEAQVGERGVKLSGGQRQRIAIARVLPKNAPILVLDEATSALDSEVEQAIQENLYALMEGKTVIAVAHRLSTIAAMDRLLIMDKGIIVEQGSHRELLDKDGLYAALWRRQSGGFLVEDAADVCAL